MVIIEFMPSVQSAYASTSSLCLVNTIYHASSGLTSTLSVTTLVNSWYLQVAALSFQTGLTDLKLAL